MDFKRIIHVAALTFKKLKIKKSNTFHQNLILVYYVLYNILLTRKARRQ